MARKKVVKIEPQLILQRPFTINEYQKFFNQVMEHGWKMADYPNGEKPTALYAILRTQTIINGEIVEVVYDLEALKQEKIQQALVAANNFTGTAQFTYKSLAGEDVVVVLKKSILDRFLQYSQNKTSTQWIDNAGNAFLLTPEDYRNLYQICEKNFNNI